MKHLLLTLLASGFCFSTFAADGWKVYFGNDKAQILYLYSDCHDVANGIHQQKILLKFINLTNQKQEISFSEELIYSNSPKPVNTDAKSYTVKLQPKEVKEGDCSTKDYSYFIFSKQLNFKDTELKKFELTNISVIDIQ